MIASGTDWKAKGVDIQMTVDILTNERSLFRTLHELQRLQASRVGSIRAAPGCRGRRCLRGRALIQQLASFRKNAHYVVQLVSIHPSEFVSTFATI